MTEFEPDNEAWKEPISPEEEFVQTLPAFAKILAAGVKAMQQISSMLLLIAFLLAMHLCNAGCASPMADWRDDVELSCYAAVDRLERGCAVPSRVDCAQGMEQADGAGCLGPYEHVLACWSREDVVVACNAWGPDVGSQCDVEEWELRTCIYPELNQ